MTMMSHILAANALITAFAAVGILMWISGAISKYLTFGRIHASAIAIMLGLALAFWGGISTGGEKGVADLPALAGIGLNNPRSAMVFGGLMGTVSGVSGGLAATDRRLVPYGALTATFHTGLGCLVAPSILYFAVRAITGG